MKTPDAFAAYHAHLIEAAYDCVDRLVVNCYYPLGQAGGLGQRTGQVGRATGVPAGDAERFLASLQAAHVAFLDGGQFERWAEPSQRGNRRLAGLDLNKARNRTVIAALSGLATQPEGFTSADLAEAVRGRWAGSGSVSDPASGL